MKEANKETKRGEIGLGANTFLISTLYLLFQLFFPPAAFSNESITILTIPMVGLGKIVTWFSTLNNSLVSISA